MMSRQGFIICACVDNSAAALRYLLIVLDFIVLHNNVSPEAKYAV